MASAIIMGVLSLIAGVSMAVSTGVSAKKQADAARHQADLEYKANVEAREAQIKENDKAFSTVTSQAQKAQLMAAGLSEQQALQVIAGNGATGEYQPAEVSSLMDGVDFSAAENLLSQGNNSSVQQALGSVQSFATDMLSTSLNAPDGGPLGAMDSGELQKFVCVNLDKLPASARGSFAGFKEWYYSDDAKDYRSAEVDKAIKSAESSMFGRKALNSFFSQSNNLLTGKEAFQMRLIEMDLKDAQKALTDEQTVLTVKQQEMQDELIKTAPAERNLIEQKYKTEQKNTQLVARQALGAQYDYLAKKMDYDINNSMYDIISESRKQTLLAQTAEAVKMARLNNDPRYIEWFLKAQTADAQGQYYISLLNACRDRTKYNLLKSDPHFNWLTCMYERMSEANMNTGLITGQVINGVGASHIVFDRLIEHIYSGIDYGVEEFNQ